MTTETINLPEGLSSPFTYTFEEFEEALMVVERRRLRQATQSSPDKRSSPGVRFMRILLGLILLGSFATLIALSDGAGFLAQRPDEFIWVRIIGPIILCFMLLGMLSSFRYRAQFGKRRLTTTTEKPPSVANAILTIVFGILVIGFETYRALAGRSVSDLLRELLLVVLPWVFVFVIIVIFSLGAWSRPGAMIHKQWEDSRYLRYEKKIAMDTERFVLVDPQGSYALRWEIIDGEEGDTIYVLLTGWVFYIVPKRVLSAEQAEFIRDRLGLRPDHLRSGGFPVAPGNLNPS